MIDFDAHNAESARSEAFNAGRPTLMILVPRC